MKVYGYDFAHSGVYGTSVSGHTVNFSYINLETGEIERPAFEIFLFEEFKVIECASADIVEQFTKLCIPHEMDMDSIDVLIPIEGGWLLLDPYHYNYGLHYDKDGSIISTNIDFNYLDLR